MLARERSLATWKTSPALTLAATRLCCPRSSQWLPAAGRTVAAPSRTLGRGQLFQPRSSATGGQLGLDSTLLGGAKPRRLLLPQTNSLASSDLHAGTRQGSLDELVPQRPGQESSPLHHGPDIVPCPRAGGGSRSRMSPNRARQPAPGRPGRDDQRSHLSAFFAPEHPCGGVRPP